MIADSGSGRVALVVHPTRDTDEALATLRRWTTEHGVDVVQLPARGDGQREVATPGELRAGDLVVTLGGDGTVLSGLCASAATNAPVLGVACGSLGALATISPEQLPGALERVRAGDWTRRRLPALSISATNAPDEWAANDFVVVRRGAGQLVAEFAVDDELYVRLAGDGLIVATPLGSSAYSMAAGGPVLASDTAAFVCTPIAMHGGNAPPLVVPADATVSVVVQAGHGGFDLEIDGHRRPLEARHFRLGLHQRKFTLVTFGPLGRGLDGLRRRRLITDSPRILARDDRAARAMPSSDKGA